MLLDAAVGQTCFRVQAPAHGEPWTGGDDPFAGLVDRMADGEHGAEAALHRALNTHLLRIAFTILRDQADAEEVVSHVFMKAWRDSANFNPRRGTVTGWLTMMVTSRARDAARAQRRSAAAVARATAMNSAEAGTAGVRHQTEDGAARALEVRELRGLLAGALCRLPHEQRKAVEIVFLRGLTHSQAAERFGLPLGTIKTRVRLGLRALRVILESSGFTVMDLT